MLDKGYAFPLHSLDLLRPGEEPPDGPLFVLPGTEGRLIVRAALLRRGKDTSTAAVRQALRRGLAHHQHKLALFATCGLDGAWAAAMAHWGERLRKEERRWLVQQGALALAKAEQRGRLQQARQLRGRLGLAVHLAGLPPLTTGRVPKAELAVIDELRVVSGKAAAHGAALEGCGFRREEREELAALVRELPAARDRLRQDDEALRVQGAVVAVLRGALLGDLSRLSLCAPQVLPPSEAASFQQRALLG